MIGLFFWVLAYILLTSEKYALSIIAHNISPSLKYVLLLLIV